MPRSKRHATPHLVGGSLFKSDTLTTNQSNKQYSYIWIQWVENKYGQRSTDWGWVVINDEDPAYERVKAVFDVMSGGTAPSVQLTQEEWNIIYKGGKNPTTYAKTTTTGDVE